MIENKQTKKPYFGISRELHKRWGHHRRCLKNNAHGNPELQEDYNKGYDFNYCILKDKLSEVEAFELEREIIREHKEFVYNFTFSGKKRSPLSEEVRQKISKSRKGKLVGEDNHFYGKKHSEESIQKMKNSLNKHDRSGGNNNFARKVEYKGVVYNSVKDAREATGLGKYRFYKKIRNENDSELRYLS